MAVFAQAVQSPMNSFVAGSTVFMGLSFPNGLYYGRVWRIAADLFLKLLLLIPVCLFILV